MRDWQAILGLPLWFWLFVLPTAFAFYCLFFGPSARRFLTPVWRVLDRVYQASGVIAAWLHGAYSGVDCRADDRALD